MDFRGPKKNTPYPGRRMVYSKDCSRGALKRSSCLEGFSLFKLHQADSQGGEGGGENPKEMTFIDWEKKTLLIPVSREFGGKRGILKWAYQGGMYQCPVQDTSDKKAPEFTCSLLPVAGTFVDKRSSGSLTAVTLNRIVGGPEFIHTFGEGYQILN